MSIHVNHPNECTHTLRKGEQLTYAGVPIYNQSVLLRNVNDNAKSCTAHTSPAMMRAALLPVSM